MRAGEGIIGTQRRPLRGEVFLHGLMTALPLLGSIRFRIGPGIGTPPPARPWRAALRD